MEKLSPIRPIGEVSAYSRSHPLCSLGLQGSDSTYGIKMNCGYSPGREPFTEFTILKDWNYLGLMNAEPILETNNYDDIVAWCKEHHDEIIQQCHDNLKAFKERYNLK